MANYIGNQIQRGEFKKLDSIESSFDGSTTTFNLVFNGTDIQVGDTTALVVSLNGVIQEPNEAYTLGNGGSQIVFSSAPAAGNTCFITQLGGIGDTITPTDGSVTTSKLANDAVTSDKLAETYLTPTGDGSQLTGINTDLVSDTSPQLGGDLASNGNNILMADTDKLVCGNGNDLQIFHNGSHSYISDVGTGKLIIQSNGDSLNLQSATDNYVICRDNAEVELYYNGAEKLATTSTGIEVTGDVIPTANATYDLGSTTNAWGNVYTNDLHLSNEGHEEGNSVDGTKGNWTIQEGEDHLYIINNKSGKKYRFALEEIE